ncbi:hypothetical protein STEG23_011846, partial [Scotinomys teguina]
VTTKITYCVGKYAFAVSLKVLILLSTSNDNCPLYCDLRVFLERVALPRLQGFACFSEKALRSELPCPQQ